MAASAVRRNGRFDAFYYSNRFLAEDAKLIRLPLQSIGLFAYVTDGPHGYHEVDEASPIAMLTARSAAHWFATRENADLISARTHQANLRSALRPGDLILSTRGTIGNCALVADDVLPANIDQDVARIALAGDSQFQAEYVTAYLNSSYGQDHVARHATGMVQQGLSLAKVREIPVPLLANETQAAMGQLVIAGRCAKRAARIALAQAESDLLDALGLHGWSPPEPLTYTRSAAAVFAAGRLDAAYFAPKYDEIADKLAATGQAVAIGDDEDALVSRGTQPDYAENGFPVVNSKHVRTNRVLLDDANRLAAPGRLRIKRGDVLINGTGVGTIGRVAPYLHEAEAIPDNHVTVVRMDGLDPVFLSVFLNSPIGQAQIERMISGSSGQIELYPADIRRILVWRAPVAVQERVNVHVQEAFEAETESVRLLAAAKRAVEIAIEQGEAAALAFVAAALASASAER